MNSSEKIRTAGVLYHATQILDAAQGMIDDCRFNHTGEGGRIGGDEEKELMEIVSEVNKLQERLRDFVTDYC